MRCAVIVFPGTSGDRDLIHAIKETLGFEVSPVSHTETNLDKYDVIFLAGGFSYGDYLRNGAIASITPIIAAIKKAANDGKPVLGIGNGFQVLVEAGILPGALLENESTKFICEQTEVIVQNNQTIFTKEYEEGEKIRLPIAHGEGRYVAKKEIIEELKSSNRIIFTYVDNQNGSLESIAGIMNEAGNVLGMMPHPERAVEALLGNEDGKRLFQSILRTREDAK